MPLRNKEENRTEKIAMKTRTVLMHFPVTILIAIVFMT